MSNAQPDQTIDDLFTPVQLARGYFVPAYLAPSNAERVRNYLDANCELVWAYDMVWVYLRKHSGGADLIVSFDADTMRPVKVAMTQESIDDFMCSVHSLIERLEQDLRVKLAAKPTELRRTQFVEIRLLLQGVPSTPRREALIDLGLTPEDEQMLRTQHISGIVNELLNFTDRNHGVTIEL